VDQNRVAILREVLSSTGWVDRTRDFARSLRRSTDEGDGLLVVGTPTREPWHLAAHLDDEARYSGIPTLAPTLVRWAPPPGAPSHLAVGLERLEHVTRHETVFLVAPDDPTEQLLERLADARRSGAVLLSVDGDDDELADLAHDRLVIPSRGLTAAGEPSGLALSLQRAGLRDLDLALPDVSFDTVQHLVSAAAGDPSILRTPTPSTSRRRLRERVARAFDTLQGVPNAPER
jgi:hypothetical protein